MKIYKLAQEISSGEAYWHGTNLEANAMGILKEGFILPDLRKDSGFLTPVSGRVYLTRSLKYAVIYALGGDYAGHAPYIPMLNKEGPYGYVFKVNGGDLSGSVQPDEDAVGEAICNRTFVWLNDIARRLVAPSRVKKVMEGQYIYFASVGKQLMPRLTQSQKEQIIQASGHVAHLGKAPIAECWKLDKFRSAELKVDGSNFFDIAARVK